MNTINIAVDYVGEVILNGYKTTAPLGLCWFPDNDLVVETECDKIVFNSKNETAPYIIRPKKPNKELQIIDGVDLRLATNGFSKYLIVDNKYAYKLPASQHQL